MLLDAGFQLGGMRLNVSSDLPLGAGLSSSAALEVATAMAAKALFELEIEKMQLAQLCQKAENEFVGVQSGLLDQASSVFGKNHQLILLDFLKITVETVSLPANASLLLLNSGVPHELTGGEYNERRKQCMLAAKSMGVGSLREANLALLENCASRRCDPQKSPSYHRGKRKSSSGVEALRSNQLEAFGELMFASHVSSRVNFENSTSHLDTLVDLARKTPGVFGSRLTGGGFGGSTVSLVETGARRRNRPNHFRRHITGSPARLAHRH